MVLPRGSIRFMSCQAEMSCMSCTGAERPEDRPVFHTVFHTVFDTVLYTVFHTGFHTVLCADRRCARCTDWMMTLSARTRIEFCSFVRALRSLSDEHLPRHEVEMVVVFPGKPRRGGTWAATVGAAPHRVASKGGRPPIPDGLPGPPRLDALAEVVQPGRSSQIFPKKPSVLASTKMVCHRLLI